MAIDNKSVPEEAVLCYARFVCDSVAHRGKRGAFFMPAHNLKAVGDALVLLLYKGQDDAILEMRKREFGREITKFNTTIPRLLSTILAALRSENNLLEYMAKFVIPGARSDPVNILRSLTEHPNHYAQILLGASVNSANFIFRVVDYC